MRKGDGGVRAWCLVLGAWSFVIGHWSLVIGHWSFVIGHWSLVIGGGGARWVHDACDIESVEWTRENPGALLRYDTSRPAGQLAICFLSFSLLSAIASGWALFRASAGAFGWAGNEGVGIGAVVPVCCARETVG